MGHYQHRGAQLIDPLQQHHDLQGAAGVQVPGGLIGDDHIGVVHQRPGNGHALLLPAGELTGIAVRLLVQPHQLEDIGDAPLQIPAGGPNGPHGKGQIFVHSFLIDQAEILKDDPQSPAHQGHLAGADIIQTVPVDHQLPLGQGDLAGDQLDHGGLSGPGGAHQKDKLSIINAEIDPLQGLGPVVVLFVDIDKSYHVCISSPVSFSCDAREVPPLPAGFPRKYVQH